MSGDAVAIVRCTAKNGVIDKRYGGVTPKLNNPTIMKAHVR